MESYSCVLRDGCRGSLEEELDRLGDLLEEPFLLRRLRNAAFFPTRGRSLRLGAKPSELFFCPRRPNDAESHALVAVVGNRLGECQRIDPVVKLRRETGT